MTAIAPSPTAAAQRLVEPERTSPAAYTPGTSVFQTSGRNLLKAEVNAGVEHHVALSVVGADRLPDSGYLRAKIAQEQLIEAAGQPYTIIRSRPTHVVSDPHARYFGTELTDTSLTPGPDPRLGPTTFTEWLAVNHR